MPRVQKAPPLKAGDCVYDVSKPWRGGRVVRVLKTRVHVEWSDGELWRYDRAHTRFLRVQK